MSLFASCFAGPQPAGSGVASFEALSEMTQRQQGQHRRTSFDVSLLENEQGWSWDGRLDTPAGGAAAEGRKLDKHGSLYIDLTK